MDAETQMLLTYRVERKIMLLATPQDPSLKSYMYRDGEGMKKLWYRDMARIMLNDGRLTPSEHALMAQGW